VGHETAFGAARVIAKASPFNPVVRYLESLQASSGAIDALCTHALGLAPDDTLRRAYVKRWLVSAVQRAKHPGCQADAILTLLGATGTRKTSFARALFGAEWLSENLSDVSDAKKIGEVVQGKWCVELAELEAFFRAERNTFISFVTRTSDRYRGAWERGNATDHPRPCVLLGTTNEPEIFRDVHGADRRRLWIVPITREIDTTWVEQNRDRVWSEAHALAQAGERWHLTDDESALHGIACEEYVQRDPWHDAVAAYLSKQTSSTVKAIEVFEHAVWRSKTTLAQVRMAPKEYGWTEQRRMGAVLRALQCKLHKGTWLLPKHLQLAQAN
jgi:predicted P-loop ATPase